MFVYQRVPIQGLLLCLTAISLGISLVFYAVLLAAEVPTRIGR